ncbi:MAG: hypothetical protein PSY14_07440 [bacterium]|nr:hypothetical protein [bacterium]
MYTRILTVAAIALLGLSTAAPTTVYAEDAAPAANAVPAPAIDAEKAADSLAAPAPVPPEEKKDGEDKDGDGKPDEPAPAPAPEGTTE